MFRFEDDKCYRMPAHFGGGAYDPAAKATYRDVTTLAYSYTTDGRQLADLLPEGFELLRPELIVQYQQCREVDWMAGSYYNLIWVAAPVRFRGRRDELEGTFALVVWENKTTPILTGNMMGIPKIYSDVEDLHVLGEKYRSSASYEGSTFLEVEMIREQPMGEQELKALHGDLNSFGWLHIPKIGGPGAELSVPTFFPMRFEPSSGWTGRGTLRWTELTWEQNPMQWHIIRALASLPMLELAPAALMKGQMILADAKGRVLQ